MFTGREYDSETGLYFYRARYYDPAIGRFISEDPIGFSGGDLNLYAYVRNNPVKYKDPLGLIIDWQGLSKTRNELLEDPFSATIIKFLENSKNTYTILVNNQGLNGDFFDPVNRTIHWDPSSPAIVGDSSYRSPELILGHELNHALMYDLSPLIYGFLRGITLGPKYGNLEEIRNLFYENSAAICRGEGLRFDHTAKPYIKNLKNP